MQSQPQNRPPAPPFLAELGFPQRAGKLLEFRVQGWSLRAAQEPLSSEDSTDDFFLPLGIVCVQSLLAV